MKIINVLEKWLNLVFHVLVSIKMVPYRFFSISVSIWAGTFFFFLNVWAGTRCSPIHGFISSMKSASKNGWQSKVPICLKKSKSTPCFCVFPKVKKAGYSPGNTPVYLNVYDLTPVNGYVYWAGVGIFHSGVEGKFACSVHIYLMMNIKFWWSH